MEEERVGGSEERLNDEISGISLLFCRSIFRRLC